MESSNFTEFDIQLWNELHNSEADFYRSRIAFFKECKDKISVIRWALDKPSHRGTALRIIPLLVVERRFEVFDELVTLASVGHSDIALCRNIILNLPRELVISRIENSVEPLLLHATDEEYRRILELYILIDKEIARRLAERALQSSDIDIIEVGEDFMPLTE